MNTTVLRIFNNFGPRAHYEGDAGEIIPRSIVRILYGEQPIVFGDGSITRDFFFVKDTAQALAIFLSFSQSARQLEIAGQTFNIGTGIEVSMKELLYKILELIESTGIGVKFMPDRPADVPRLWVAPHRFTELTKFNPAYSFEEGLKETILFYKNKMVQKNMLEEIKINNWIK
jgi:UDP-glucose 4-epimerase